MTSIFSVAPAQRMPISVFASLAIHGAALGLFAYTVELSNQQVSHTIANVDLMVQVKKPMAALPHAAAQAAPPPEKMLDFFKMALPAIPKVEEQQLQVKVPEEHQLKMNVPKLQDRGRLIENQLNALKLDERRPDQLSALDVGQVQAHHRSMAALAALPKLEEVGRRRIKNLPSALKMDDEREQAQAMMQMNALTTPTHHYVAPVSESLQEAQPDNSSSFTRKLASMLPTQPPPLEVKPELRPADDTLTKKIFAEPVKQKSQAQLLPGDSNKGVQLEGPIKDRKIVSYDIPEFPAWAKAQGILEADVAIRFWVSPQGDVLDSMRIERTSGFGRLDREAMGSLKNWKFAPLLNDEKQWGIITFKFVLE